MNVNQVDKEMMQKKFMKFYESYEEHIYLRAMKLLRDQGRAEDALQTTMINIFENLDKIDEVDSQETKKYLNTTLTNVCVNILRENRKYSLSDDIMIYGEEYAAVEIARQNKDIDYQIVLKEVKKLPKRYIQVLILHALYDLTPKQISEILGISDDTVRQRIRRGRQKLLDNINDDKKKKR